MFNHDKEFFRPLEIAEQYNDEILEQFYHRDPLKRIEALAQTLTDQYDKNDVLDLIDVGIQYAIETLENAFLTKYVNA